MVEIRKLIRLASILAIIASLLVIGHRIYLKYQIKAVNDSVARRADELIEANYKEKTDYKKLIEDIRTDIGNDSVIAKLTFDKLDINLLIVESEDDEYWLSHDLNEEYSIAGTLFLDRYNNSDFKDYNSTIYGHNMLDGSMFASLKKLLNQDFVDNGEANTFTLLTQTGEFTYDVIAVRVLYPSRDDYIVNYDKDWIKEMKDNSSVILSDPTKNTKDDNYVTLSTCNHAEGDDRVVVVGKMRK
ncbi:MAG: class B sortase [Helcococcus sp.]|nr:class B sortase [Helcococcus sp.]